MTGSPSDRRVPRTRAFASAFAVALMAAVAAAAPTNAQSVTVIGDPGAQACSQAAMGGSVSRVALENCDSAILSGKLRRRDLAGTYINRGIIHAGRGDLHRALADYDEARRLIPDIPEAFVGEGNARFLMGQFDRALALYAEALELGLNAEHAAHFNRGLVLEQLKRWDESEAAYLEAVEFAPDWPLPLAHLERLAALRAQDEAQRATN